MLNWRRTLACTTATLALLPAAASAQSAGDEQYEDPFSDEPAPTQPTPAPTAAPAPAAPAPSTSSQAQPEATEAAPAPATPAAPSASGQSELPRTGADPLLAVLGGGLLLVAGAGLRVRSRADGRRTS